MSDDKRKYTFDELYDKAVDLRVQIASMPNALSALKGYDNVSAKDFTALARHFMQMTNNLSDTLKDVGDQMRRDQFEIKRLKEKCGEE